MMQLLPQIPNGAKFVSIASASSPTTNKIHEVKSQHRKAMLKVLVKHDLCSTAFISLPYLQFPLPLNDSFRISIPVTELMNSNVANNHLSTEAAHHPSSQLSHFSKITAQDFHTSIEAPSPSAQNDHLPSSAARNSHRQTRSWLVVSGSSDSPNSNIIHAFAQIIETAASTRMS